MDIRKLYEAAVRQFCERIDEYAEAQIAELKVVDAKEFAEAEAYLSTPPECKNAEKRAAWVKKQTWREHAAATEAKARRIRAWAEYERAKARMNYVKRLMSTAEEE